ncbi:MAG: hypothetical protein IPN90_08910 [Elusimicrobia bacterium]|nr:hypothetical protein [Elusimicrobiota bacterium]
MKRIAMAVVVALFSVPSVFAGDMEDLATWDREAAQRSFFVPGWGQWYKGYPARGTSIAVAEGVALIGAYASYQSARRTYDDYQAGTASYSSYTRRVDTANYLMIAAGIIWVYNVADAYTSSPAPRLTLSLGDGRMARLTYRMEFQ